LKLFKLQFHKGKVFAKLFSKSVNFTNEKFFAYLAQGISSTSQIEDLGCHLSYKKVNVKEYLCKI